MNRLQISAQFHRHVVVPYRAARWRGAGTLGHSQNAAHESQMEQGHLGSGHRCGAGGAQPVLGAWLQRHSLLSIAARREQFAHYPQQFFEPIHPASDEHGFAARAIRPRLHRLRLASHGQPKNH